VTVGTDPRLRDARPGDAAAIAEIDASRAGTRKPEYWDRMLREYGPGSEGRVALVAEDDRGDVSGFLLGEVRAWEFGSERCGWVFSVAVRPGVERGGTATRLCEAAVRRFGALGVRVVRTMVRRNDVPMLALFRSLGFRAGPFSEMETRVPRAATRRGGTT
jgi:ribosomal protein S18 acetylase RimI-like enzyme